MIDVGEFLVTVLFAALVWTPLAYYYTGMQGVWVPVAVGTAALVAFGAYPGTGENDE